MKRHRSAMEFYATLSLVTVKLCSAQDFACEPQEVVFAPTFIPPFLREVATGTSPALFSYALSPYWSDASQGDGPDCRLRMATAGCRVC
jgi:hypothetical protein